MSTISTKNFETAAVLRAAGIGFVRSESIGPRRVALVWDNTDGKADDILQKHETGALRCRTRDLTDALLWSKNMIMSSREAA
ncbi:MAG: hypothetical protein NTX50_22095 [Candidatus Sumerlaeota bacterium]|nr:hypothetical protein [Candidatus Sumerlaeota bacterium]